jgi:hypothetical protein
MRAAKFARRLGFEGKSRGISQKLGNSECDCHILLPEQPLRGGYLKKGRKTLFLHTQDTPALSTTINLTVFFNKTPTFAPAYVKRI